MFIAVQLSFLLVLVFVLFLYVYCLQTCEGGICSRNEDCIVCTAGIDKRSLEDCKKLNRCEEQIESAIAVSDISKNISKSFSKGVSFESNNLTCSV